jgi:hypothetical protein
MTTAKAEAGTVTALENVERLRAAARAKVDGWLRASRQQLLIPTPPTFAINPGLSRTQTGGEFMAGVTRVGISPGVLAGGIEVVYPPQLPMWFLLGFDDAFYQSWVAALTGEPEG